MNVWSHLHLKLKQNLYKVASIARVDVIYTSISKQTVNRQPGFRRWDSRSRAALSSKITEHTQKIWKKKQTVKNSVSFPFHSHRFSCLEELWKLRNLFLNNVWWISISEETWICHLFEKTTRGADYDRSTSSKINTGAEHRDAQVF